MISVDKEFLDYSSSLSSIGSFLISILSLFVLTYIAFKTLQYTAKPNLRITLTGKRIFTIGKIQNRKKKRSRPIFSYKFTSDEKVTLQFVFENIGHWFAKPAIVINELYFNFANQFELQNVKYGSALEREKTIMDVCLGKKDDSGLNCKYFQIADIHLFYGEPCEEVRVELITPQEPGIYRCWISAKTKDASFNVKTFYFKVS